MSWVKCLGEIKRATGIDDMTDEEAEQMLDDVLARKERIMRERALGDTEATTEAATAIATEEAEAAARAKQAAQMNLQRRIQRRARIEDTAQDITKSGKPLDLATAMQNQVVAINTPTRGGRLSAEAEAKTRTVQYLGGIDVDLQRAGLFGAVRGGSLEREWGRELFELSKQAAGEPAEVGKTGNKEAQSIAEIFFKYQSLAKQNLNRLGAWIGDYSGYITRTVHNSDKIRRGGFEAWRDFVLPRLDAEKTFGGSKPDGFLKTVYSGLITGEHLTGGFEGMKAPAFKGPGNLAKKVSEERLLHFKDADGWLDYQKQFGTGTLLEQMMRTFERSARDEALLSRWGTNPRAEFEADMRYLKQKYRAKDPDAVTALGEKEKHLTTLFDYLDGTANRPANALGAKIGSYIRLDESLSKLGMVAFTHLSAGVTKAAELRYQGVNLLEGYRNFASSIFEGRGSGEKRELADLMLAGTEGTTRDLMSGFNLDDTLPGKASKLANIFFKYTGLTYLLNAQKTGAQFVLARQLGRLVGKEFDALPDETKRGLSQYDISAQEWDLLRNAPDHPEIDGRAYLTPDAAHRSQSELGLGSLDARDRLALKLHAYLNDVAERSVITPGISERAMLLGGSRPGTLIGEALRFIAQFKTWPVAAVRQGLFRDIRGSDNTAQAIGGVLNLAVGSLITGTMILEMKSLMKGQNLRPLDDPRTWIAGLMQGGGFGILGDFLFGEYSRFGQGFTETLAGPTLGAGLSTVLDLWNKAKDLADGKAKHPEKTADSLMTEGFRTVVDHMPFVNLFYVRAALNYLLLWRIQEWMNPGWARRYERKMEHDQNQTFWLSPTEAVR